MGALREKAEAEREEERLRRQEQQRQDAERRKRDHAEKVQPVVDFLKEWSGEEINAEMLEHIPTRSGPPQWEIAIDDFVLRVQAVGRPPEDVQILIEQKMENGQWRDVFKPKDLLDSEPVEAPS